MNRHPGSPRTWPALRARPGPHAGRCGTPLHRRTRPHPSPRPRSGRERGAGPAGLNGFPMKKLIAIIVAAAVGGVLGTAAAPHAKPFLLQHAPAVAARVFPEVTRTDKPAAPAAPPPIEIAASETFTVKPVTLRFTVPFSGSLEARGADDGQVAGGGPGGRGAGGGGRSRDEGRHAHPHRHVGSRNRPQRAHRQSRGGAGAARQHQEEPATRR